MDDSKRSARSEGRVRIVSYNPNYAEHVRALFVEENQRLQAANPKFDFGSYIRICLAEEFSSIETYYASRGGAFWVVLRDDRFCGMFGLERRAADTFELRRMYLAPDVRGSGMAEVALSFAEKQARDLGASALFLETSCLQPRALGFYEKSGYVRLGTVYPEEQSNKTVGAGIERYQLLKQLTTSG